MKKEDYIKNNICPLCDGKALFKDGHVNGDIKCICGDGTYVGNLIFDLKSDKNRYSRLMKDYKELQKYVNETSQCKKCKGNQYNVPGGTNCKCGLPGLAPWGG